MFGAACGALAITLLFGVLWLTGNVRINGPSPEAFESGAVVSAAILCFFGVLFFAVGFMEELCFRGYAMHNLAAWGGLRFAIAVQAVVFAFVHLGNVVAKIPDEGAAMGTGVSTPPSLLDTLMDTRVALLNIALIGVFFALSYIKTGSLWFPIGFHAAWNFFLGCVWSMPVSGVGTFRVLDVSVSSNVLLTGGDFGAEGSILLTPLLLVLLWVVWQEADHPQAHSDLAESRAAPESHTAPKPAAVASEAGAPVEAEYVPSRFRTTMRPTTSAGVPLPVDANGLRDPARTAPFTRDVTASMDAATNGSTSAAPNTATETSTEAAPVTPLDSSDELSVYKVDVTASEGTVSSSAAPMQNSAPEAVTMSGRVEEVTPQVQLSGSEPLVEDPQSEGTVSAPQTSTATATVATPAPTPTALPQAAPPQTTLPQESTPAVSPPASSRVESTPPPATLGTKKPRPRW
jgi:membrane protease YdiL (CAAX protease family)